MGLVSQIAQLCENMLRPPHRRTRLASETQADDRVTRADDTVNETYLDWLFIIRSLLLGRGPRRFLGQRWIELVYSDIVGISETNAFVQVGYFDGELLSIICRYRRGA